MVECPSGPCENDVDPTDYRCQACGKDLVEANLQTTDPDRSPEPHT